jgi:hypothetical protein
MDTGLERDLKRGWGLIAAGLLFPVLALGGAGVGWIVRRRDARHGWALLALGVAVFALRVGLYLA